MDLLTDVIARIVIGLAQLFTIAGPHQWTCAIVVLGFLTRVLLLPVHLVAARHARALARVKPEIDRLRRRHRKDPERLRAEMSALYRREGVRPAVGCLAPLAQAPIMLGVFGAIRTLTAARDAGGFGIGQMPFLGIGNLAQRAASSPAGVLLVAVTAAAGFFGGVERRDPTPARTQTVLRLAQASSAVFALALPGALALFWATQSVLLLVQRMLIRA